MFLSSLYQKLWSKKRKKRYIEGGKEGERGESKGKSAESVVCNDSMQCTGAVHTYSDQYLCHPGLGTEHVWQMLALHSPERCQVHRKPAPRSQNGPSHMIHHTTGTDMYYVHVHVYATVESSINNVGCYHPKCCVCAL